MRPTSSFATPVFVVIVIGGAVLSYVIYGVSASWQSYCLMPVAFLLAIIVSFAIKIADQWERAVVLRLGRFQALRGPGLFLIVPIVDVISHWIDTRVITSAFKAEKIPTKDTVPERQIAEKFGEAAKTYAGNPTAFHLRAMSMLYERLKQNSTIVIVPSSAAESMQLGGIAGLTALTMGLSQRGGNPPPSASPASPAWRRAAEDRGACT